MAIVSRRCNYIVFLLVCLLSAGRGFGGVRTGSRGTVERNPESEVTNTSHLQKINGEILHYTLGSHVIYVSPVPGSKYLTTGTNIIVRSDENINPGTVQNDLFKVVGSSSGEHAGKAIMVSDQRTILFQPDAPFSLGEKVNVSMTHPLLSVNGDTILANPFSFAVSVNDMNADRALIAQIGYGIPNVPIAVGQAKSPAPEAGSVSSQVQLNEEPDSLPSDLPRLMVTKSDSPSAGYIFLATNMNHTYYKRYGNYLMIVDNIGRVLFYRNTGQDPAWNFTIQPAGQLTYFTPYGRGWFFTMNTSLQVIDSMTAANGYYGDGHEIRIMPNGNIFILADDYEYVDMSKIVPGGYSQARLVDVVIQEFDPNGDLIFNWRCIDHFNITDALGQNLDSTVVDPFHCNAIEIEPDGNILLSSRHLSEITKINVQTGDIMWRLGGKNNQFTFTNDSIGFSYQHDIRKLADGDITLMDNGNMHTPPFSRAVQYKLDEVNKTATLVWQFRHSPDAYNPYMGNVQRLPNGNTFIGWGGAATPAITEVRPDGSTALEMTFPNDSVWTYRAYRYPFLFTTSPTDDDSVQAGDSTKVRWTSSGVGFVDVACSEDAGNSWSNLATNYPARYDSLTFAVPPDSGTTLQFRIVQSGVVNRGQTYYTGALSIVGGVTSVKSSTNPDTYYLSDNYPNPFNPTTTINYQLAASTQVTLTVYDILGRRVATLVNEKEGPGEHSVKFDGTRFASGVYFYRLTTSSGFVEVKKMVLEK